MTISRVKPSSWAFGEVLTSAQMNALDSNLPLTVDGRLGALDVPSRTVTRVLNGFITPQVAANWTVIGQFGSHCSVTSQQFLRFSLNLPQGCTLTTLYVAFRGGASHSALPATKPTAAIFKQAYTATAPTQIGTTITDAPASIGAYESQHILGPVSGAGPTFTGLTEVIDNTLNAYLLLVSTEGGANAVVDDIVGAIVAQFTLTKLDEV